MERSGRPASAPVRGTRPADLETVSDAGLVVAIGRFHHDALAEAYRRHGAASFGLALRIVADRRLAEEVVQEVFLRLWNEPEKFDPERGSLRSYLLAQAHGRSVDLVRAESARRAREEREAPTENATRSSSPTSADTHIARWRCCSASRRGP